MLKKTLVTALAFIALSFTYAQQKEKIDTVRFECIYNLKFQQDSTDKYLQEEPMILFIGKNTSKFYSYNTFLRDEALQNNVIPLDEMDNFTFNELKAAQRQAAPSPRFRFDIYKHHNNNEITATEYVIPDYYLYTEPMNQMDWEIQEEASQKILNFNVTKATTEFAGRTWEAWFAPEIPVGEGPYKFCGLPGLIVKISDTAGHYSFNLVSLEIPDDDKYIYFEKKPYIKTSKKQFFKIKSNFYNSIMDNASQAGFDEAQKQQIIENVKKRNNPIELIVD